MAADPQSPERYRAARKAFIAACEADGVDVIARVHPAKGADGKPLFLDSAALGPRHARKALLLISAEAQGSALQTELMQDGPVLPPEARLVLVHGLDPVCFASGSQGDPGPYASWPLAMLRAVRTEDLAWAGTLTVVMLGEAPGGLADALAQPGGSVTVTALPPDAAARDAIGAMLAAL